MYDVIIVGGSSAGLSGALVLGRARRQVLVIDSGKPCNRFSHASHGFLTRDGVAPDELLQIARDQLKPYEGVELYDGLATHITREDEGFRVETEAGESFSSRTVLLATGVKDTLPPLPGVDAFWGKSVFHCPYCDGWEVRDQPIVVHGGGESGAHKIMLLRQWSDNLTWCIDGDEVTDEQRERARRHGIKVIDTKISKLEGTGEQIERIVFEDGSTLALKAMFIAPKLSHPMPFAEQLGCKVSAHGIIEIDPLGRTNIPGVYAAGDLANGARSVAASVAHGSAAGAGINFDLVQIDFA
jgi:thioredoxin reductase